ncbi:ATP-binding protein [Sphingobacterium sp. SGL-16]|uniref:ATP-binding protein n=1 Tax=Sphingobacterium sp. SGL-16 TaxID=2710883 RepID=UPI0013EDFC2E|nr:ATP-binding protein [Sphingobacterium sp. SGL-16]NGM72521.1 transcriptional regulator [Sphingobacterium sp. SGL-16]
MADTFFRAGYIESWGRGIEKMLTAFQEAGLPEPIFEESWGGVMVTLLKDIYTEVHLRTLDINERQIRAILFIKEHGSITNTAYQKLNNLGKTFSTTELIDLSEKQLIEKVGTTSRGTRYVLKGRNGHK